MKHTLLLIFIFVAGSFAASAFAEGCEEGQQHAPSVKEKAYYADSFKTLRDAVPKPPAGWEYSRADKKKLDPGYSDVPSYLCGDTQSYYIGLDMGYERPVSDADSQKQLEAMQAKPDPAKQKELDGLMAEQQDLIQKSMAAAQKQDYATIQALGKQGDALNAKITEVQQEMNAGQAATLAAIQHDRTAKVRIAINDAGDASCDGNPKPIQVPGAIAYECEHSATFSSPGNQMEPAKGRVVVVFGEGVQAVEDKWNRMDDRGQHHDDSGVMLKHTLQQGSAPAVQFLTVDVEGDDLARAMSLYKQINLAQLAALLNH